MFVFINCLSRCSGVSARGWLDHKPVRKIEREKEDEGRITYLTAAQIQRLFEFAKQDQNSHVYPFIVIGLETSMRKMEILSIRLEHIDLVRSKIYIPKGKDWCAGTTYHGPSGAVLKRLH